MGYMNGDRVHYWDAPSGRCIPLMITDDHAPEYNDVVSGVLIEAGPVNGAPAVLTTRLDVEHDDDELTEKEMSTVTKTHSTWHHPQECPERFNDDNRDTRKRRRPRPGPPVLDGPVRPRAET